MFASSDEASKQQIWSTGFVHPQSCFQKGEYQDPDKELDEVGRVAASLFLMCMAMKMAHGLANWSGYATNM